MSGEKTNDDRIFIAWSYLKNILQNIYKIDVDRKQDMINMIGFN